MAGDARGEYEGRVGELRGTAAAAEKRERQLANGRLAAFVVALGVGWLILATSASAWWITALVIGFIGLIAAHDRARRSHRRALRAVAYYERALLRLDYAFAGTGRSGERFRDPEHPYADHLDLFGRGALFELLSTAQTDAGVATLARWLKEPAPVGEIRDRQAAVAELRSRVDLREDLAVLGPDAREGLDPRALAEWGEAPAALVHPVFRIAAALLAVTAVAAAIAIPFAGIGPIFFVALVAGAFALPFRSRSRRIASEVERPLRNLDLLTELLERVERERFEAPALVAIRDALETEGVSPSREIARLRTLAYLLEQRRNQLFAPISPFLLWTTQIAFAIEAWRAQCGPRLPGWIAALGELEALLDLSGYAYEHPDDPFPEIAEDGPVFAAEGLGHPLLADEQSIRNDLRLDRELSLFVISGSNMSGKSTLLRTVGTNTVLALMGAPVRARRLLISPLQVGASIVVVDSLQEGASRFYAEIRRLRHIVDLVGGSAPVLFLLDEILAGTNSHDRGIGAAALVRGLVERGAVGLLTTHDLALARIADELAPRASNVHFEDQLVDGRMHFDYHLREGVVTHSNALALMRSVGLGDFLESEEA